MVSRSTAARVVVITHADTAHGFALAGATVITARSAADAQQALERLLAEGERGVVAIDEPFYEEFDAELRGRLEGAATPVVMPLPTGVATTPSQRRARLGQMLQRVIGYQITFEEPKP